MIPEITAEDAPALCGIYNDSVRNTVIAFDETIVSADRLTGR